MVEKGLESVMGRGKVGKALSKAIAEILGCERVGGGMMRVLYTQRRNGYQGKRKANDGWDIH